jgi:hypothetical protein
MYGYRALRRGMKNGSGFFAEGAPTQKTIYHRKIASKKE